jgi:hypothetical protein
MEGGYMRLVEKEIQYLDLRWVVMSGQSCTYNGYLHTSEKKSKQLLL